MDVEKIATSAIESLISRNSYLKSNVESNDKTPIWDGDIFVYKNKNSNKNNTDLIGRIPVQVKGHKVKSINKDIVKFRVKLNDIKKYNEDGGVIFFVVYTTGFEEKIYYNSLLPLDLSRLIKRYNNQKSLQLNFKKLPVEENVLVDIFLDFIDNSKKQMGTLIPDLLYINDTEEIKEQIKQFKFSYRTIDPKRTSFFKELTTRDIYVYIEPKGIGNPIPIEKVSNAIIKLQDKFKIRVKEKEYYNDAYIQWENGIPSIIFSKSIVMSIPNFKVDKKIDINFKIKFEGTLNERLHNLNFIRDMLENKGFYLKDTLIPVEDSNFKYREDLYKRINEFKNLKQRLEYYGIKKDLNFDAVKDNEFMNLDIITERYPSFQKYNIDLSKSRMLRMKIANVLILLIVEENKERECYKFKNFFSNNWKTKYIFKETNEEIYGSQFLILDKETLLADNLNSNFIMKSIKENHNKKKNIEHVTSFLLEAIKAYDKSDNQKPELNILIDELSKWLYLQSEEDIYLLNKLQVKYRLEKLEEEDIVAIRNIRKKHKNNIEMLAGISILLDEKENARETVNKMNKKQKDMFISYPIYNLLEE